VRFEEIVIMQLKEKHMRRGDDALLLMWKAIMERYYAVQL
jgi:hypothetical protein